GSTYVRAPAAPAPGLAPGERAVWAASQIAQGPPWRFSGGVQDLGSEIHLHGALRFDSANDINPIYMVGRASRVFDAAGEPMPDLGVFSTAFLTPSGLPLERMTKQADPAQREQDCAPVRESATTIRC